MTNDDTLIQRIAEAVVMQMAPAIPLSIELWDMATIGAYVKRDPNTVQQRLACLPSFPKAIRLPSATKRGHPLYKAEEVIKWVESHKEKN